MKPQVTSSEIRHQYEITCRIDKHTTAHARLEVSLDVHEDGAVRLSATGHDLGFVPRSTLHEYVTNLAYHVSGEIAIEKVVPAPRRRLKDLDLGASTVRAAVLDQATYRPVPKRSVDAAVDAILQEFGRLTDRT